jgi:hypothetical protein
MTTLTDVQRAVDRALGDGRPRTLHAAALHEQEALWYDLDQAIKHAINRRWSMECEWLTERIAVLAILTRHVTPRDSIPETFPRMLYRDIKGALRARF